MSRLTAAVTNQQTASEHEARYEVLRQQALERHAHAPVVRHGLVVLLRQGVAGWMDAWSKLPVPAPQTAKDESRRSCPLPDGSSAEVVRVLVAMALGHMKEVYA